MPSGSFRARIISSVLCLLALSCERIGLPDNVSDCLKKTIRHPHNNQQSPQSVWEMEWNGDSYFLFIPHCCDQLFQLYDAECHYICSPSGGFTGEGDKSCPTFHDEAKTVRLVWTED